MLIRNLLDRCRRDKPEYLNNDDNFVENPQIRIIKHNLTELIKQKKLDPEAFKPGKIKLTDHISQHVSWIYEKIYSVPYIGSHSRYEDIPRMIHGIQHVSRAAMYVPIFANLYRRYGNTEALGLNEDDLKHLQLCLLFHDAARENEGEDLWDHESASLLFCYLTKVLGIDKQKAIQLAEATANKDMKKVYHKLVVDENDNATWLPTRDIPPKTIFQKIIHDADCLDIIRAREVFEAKYLDFYNDIAKDNPVALDEMAQLITEARSIIYIQGDSYSGNKYKKTKIKRRYESQRAYQEILDCVYFPSESKEEKTLVKETDPRENYCVLPHCYANGKLLSGDALRQPLMREVSSDIDEKTLSEEMRKGNVFARGIAYPSAIRKKEKKKNLLPNEHKEKKSEYEETLAEVEIRKMLRRIGISTLSGSIVKEGNPDRSVSMLGWGAATFSNAGFLIVKPDVFAIQEISKTDVSTGFNKKKGYISKGTNKTEEKFAQWKDLLYQQKMGGASTRFGNQKTDAATHNEIIYHIKNVDAVFFTQDPNLANSNIYHEREIVHPHAPKLEAVFLQKEYKKKTGKTLPIFEYSGLHNFIKKQVYCDKQIIEMWREMCRDYMTMELKHGHFNVLKKSNEELKTLSMYKVIKHNYAKCNASADANYDPELQKEVNQVIEEERQKLLNNMQQSLRNKVLEEKTLNFSNMALAGLFHPQIVIDADMQQKISDYANQFIQTNLIVELDNVLNGRRWGHVDNVMVIELIKNKKSFYTENTFWEKIHIIYNNGNNPIISIYDLAIKLNITNVAQSIHKQAANVAKDFMKKAITKIDWDTIRSLQELMLFIANFSLFTELKDDLCHFISNLIKFSLKQNNQNDASIIKKLFNSDNETVDSYYLLRHFLNDYNILNLPFSPEEMEYVNKLGKRLLQSREKNTTLASQYLELCQQANIHLSTQREIIKNFIVKLNKLNVSSDSSFTTMLGKSSLLNDPEIFQLCLDKIEYTIDSDNESLYFIKDYYKLFCASLDMLKEGLPDQSFNESQSKLVQNKKEKVTLYYINKLTAFYDTSNFFRIIDSYCFFSNQIDITIAEQKKTLLNWFKIDKQPFIQEHDYIKIKIFNNIFSDHDFFEELVKKIQYKNEQGEVDKNVLNHHIGYLRKAMPLQKFTPQQEKLIQARIRDLFPSFQLGTTI